jgi:hypothetical protein
VKKTWRSYLYPGASSLQLVESGPEIGLGARGRPDGTDEQADGWEEPASNDLLACSIWGGNIRLRNWWSYLSLSSC